MALSGVAFAGDADEHPNRRDTSTTRATVVDDKTGARTTVVTDDGQPRKASREQTMEMQRALTARNLYQGPADGVWGPKTESALRNFQTQSGLPATGQFDNATARALGLDGNRPATDRQPVAGTDKPVQAASPSVGTATPHSQAHLEDGATNVHLSSLSTEQAREMQQRLQLLGYYRGEVDGKVGEGTRDALRRYFQRQAELAQQGVINNSAISLFGTEASDVQPVSGKDTARPAP
jgi:peptidoglycan hydrolase-like protein with peptidoglycan-binding domain